MKIDDLIQELRDWSEGPDTCLLTDRAAEKLHQMRGMLIEVYNAARNPNFTDRGKWEERIKGILDS